MITWPGEIDTGRPTIRSCGRRTGVELCRVLRKCCVWHANGLRISSVAVILTQLLKESTTLKRIGNHGNQKSSGQEIEQNKQENRTCSFYRSLERNLQGIMGIKLFSYSFEVTKS